MRIHVTVKKGKAGLLSTVKGMDFLYRGGVLQEGKGPVGIPSKSGGEGYRI
jgi:hypothetical protein